jgi:hypothetical protein
MKNEILKRAMFAMPLTKDARNSGIMAGFEDEMPETPEDNVDEMPQMARTPQNPEILMNTLRGDMRSVDARYQELAQLVGEDAAMETPPEVLAMLMGQMGTQQGGIGSLPQGQAMAPPPMGMPPQGGEMPPAPEAAPPPGGMPPPQGGMPPLGMGAAGPFPQGGAEQAPPTPDGMPPMKAALGAFITPATRIAQMAGDKIGQYGSAANAALGRMFMTPQGITQPFLENVRGPAGRFTAEQVVRGGEALTAPTFSQGLMQGTARLADQYPRLSAMMLPAAGVAGLAAAPTGGPNSTGTDLMSQIPTDSAESMAQNSVLNQQPVVTMDMDQPSTTTRPDRYKITEGPRPAAPVEAPVAEFAPTTIGPVRPDEFGTLAEVGDEKKSTQDFIKAALREKTRSERTREGYAELAPLFQEILGDNKEDMKTNALLMLADAGFKLASSRQPTAAMAIGEAASGLPRGFMALLAQSKDRDLKIKSAALSQAFTDVQEQDKYAQQTKMEVLKGDFRLLLEQAKNGGATVSDGGAGLRISTTKQGGFVGASVDPKDPTVQSAVQSRWTLRDTDNPFVENRGQAPTTVETDKGERIKLTSTLRALDNSLSTLDNLKGTYTNLYSPGTWFVDKVNNLIVPISGGVVRPDVNQADAAQRVQTGMNSILKSIASANDSGRVAVQEQEWARDTAKGISDPTAFFQNKELAAKGFVSMEAMLRNARQQTLTQLGFENNDYSMRTPNTGTENDPFVIPTDKDNQRVMFNFLGSTIGKLQDPKAMVHVRMPNNTIQQFNPTQLRGLIGNQ